MNTRDTRRDSSNNSRVEEYVAPGNALPSLCSAFQVVGPMLSSQASLLETISNDFFGLPLVTPSASAARAVTFFASKVRGLRARPSFLFGVQPDILEEMKALARLILDMKTERDNVRGW